MQTQLTNLRHRWDKAKLTKTAVFWIAIAVVVLTIFLGFSQGGWVTAGTANRMAEIKSQDVLLERLAPICMAQFDEDPQRAQKLDELTALTTSVQRTRYVKDQTWAIMPGEAAADDRVAAKCAEQLTTLGAPAP